ncbi:helix-turn-helix transcriptional regulator [Exiguobacterium algae]|uniref:helix-turn-helix transcriptional regulator n=1 Tax=Exiguobacterium algae TaxID=2751250 RepID=UPI001BEB31C2|nr:helix-turn-helix domain-containing protein [Exiguobacterium algae]
MNKSAFIQLVSKKIKLVRTEYHYSQDEMAEAIGVSKKTLIQIEKERIEANWSTVVTVCALFNESEILVNAIGDDPIAFVKLIAMESSFEPQSRTLGGKVWWKKVRQEGQFVLQQNLISGHYRILDSEHRRWYSSFDFEDAVQALKRMNEETGRVTE